MKLPSFLLFLVALSSSSRRSLVLAAASHEGNDDAASSTTTTTTTASAPAVHDCTPVETKLTQCETLLEQRQQEWTKEREQLSQQAATTLEIEKSTLQGQLQEQFEAQLTALKEQHAQEKQAIEQSMQNKNHELSQALEEQKRQEGRIAELQTTKDELQNAVTTTSQTLEETQQELLRQRQEVIQIQERAAVLEKENMYYWDLLDAWQEQIQAWYEQAVQFLQTDPHIQSFQSQVHQRVVEPVLEVTQPHMKQARVALEPHVAQVQEATAPTRKQIAETWNTTVQPFLSKQHAQVQELFCTATEFLADYAKEAPPVVRTATARLNKHCAKTLYYTELFLVLYVVRAFLWRILFGTKSSKKKVVVKKPKKKVNKNKKVQ